MNIGELSFNNRNKIQRQLILPHCSIFQIQKDKAEWYFPSQNLFTLKKKLQNTSLIKFCEIKSQENQIKTYMQRRQKQNGQLLIVKINKTYLQDKLKHIINQHICQNEQVIQNRNNKQIKSCHVCDSYQADYCTSLVQINDFRNFLLCEIQKQITAQNYQITTKQSYQVVQKIFNINCKQKYQNFEKHQNEGVNNQHLKLDAIYFIIKLKDKNIKNYQKQKDLKIKQIPNQQKLQFSQQQNEQGLIIGNKNSKEYNRSAKNMDAKDEIIQVEWTNNYLLLNHIDVKKFNNYIQVKNQKQETKNIEIRVKNNKKISEHMKLKLSQKCEQLQQQIKNHLQTKYSQLIDNKSLSILEQTLKVQSFRLWSYVNSQNKQIYTILVSDIKVKINNTSFQLYSKIQIGFNPKTLKIVPDKTKNIASQQFINNGFKCSNGKKIKVESQYKFIIQMNENIAQKMLKTYDQKQEIVQCKCCKEVTTPEQASSIINKNIPLIQLFKKIKMTKINDFDDLYQMVQVCHDCYDIFLKNIFNKELKGKQKKNVKQNGQLFGMFKTEIQSRQLNRQEIRQKEKQNCKNYCNYYKKDEQSQNNNKRKLSLLQLTQNTQISTLNKNQDNIDIVKNLQQKQINYLLQKGKNKNARRNYYHKNASNAKSNNVNVHTNDNTRLYCYKSKSIYQTSNVSTIGTSQTHSSKGRKSQFKQKEEVSKIQHQKISNEFQNQNNHTNNLQEERQDKLFIELKQKNTVQIPKRSKLFIDKISNTKYIQMQHFRNKNNLTLHQAKLDQNSIKKELRNQNLISQQMSQKNKIDKHQFKQMILNEIYSYNRTNKCKQSVSEHRKKEQQIKSLNEFQKNKKQEKLNLHKIDNKQ